MLREVVFSVLTGAFAGVLFELFANEIPNAALLSAAVLHLWVVLSGMMSANSFQYIFQPRIPFKWSMGIVMIAYIFLHFKSQAMENLPMPVFIVCSNMKLLMAVVLDYFVFSKPFATPGQIVGVICVTAGCIAITLQSQEFTDGKEYLIEYNTSVGLLYVFISVLAVSLLLPLSNLAVTRHPGSSFDELSFMQHLLSLPLFYPLRGKLLSGVQALSVTPKVMCVPVPSLVATATASLLNFFHWNDAAIDVTVTSSCSLSNGLSLGIPVALLCMLGTILLTPLHRKQISRVSITANNSVLGQLIVCAVKTVVLLALLVILRQNSPSSAENEFPSQSCDDSESYGHVDDRVGWQSVARAWTLVSDWCLAMCAVLRSSVVPSVLLGVVLQTLGSLGFILFSPSPPREEVPERIMSKDAGGVHSGNDGDNSGNILEERDGCDSTSGGDGDGDDDGDGDGDTECDGDGDTECDGGSSALLPVSEYSSPRTLTLRHLAPSPALRQEQQQGQQQGQWAHVPPFHSSKELEDWGLARACTSGEDRGVSHQRK